MAGGGRVGPQIVGGKLTGEADEWQSFDSLRSLDFTSGSGRSTQRALTLGGRRRNGSQKQGRRQKKLEPFEHGGADTFGRESVWRGAFWREPSGAGRFGAHLVAQSSVVRDILAQSVSLPFFPLSESRDSKVFCAVNITAMP